MGKTSLEVALSDSLRWANHAIPNRTKTSTIRKLMAEMGELADSDFADPSEFADVLICLYDLADLAGVDLSSAVADKVLVNASRNWVQQKNGTYQHI